MTTRTRPWKVALGIALGWLGASACSDDSASTRASGASVTAATSVPESQAAHARIDELRELFPVLDGEPPLASAPPDPRARFKSFANPPLIGPGSVMLSAAPDGRLYALAPTLTGRVEKPARVELPPDASGAVTVEDVESKLAVSLSIAGAGAAPAGVHDGIAVYRDALGAGVDVVQRPTPEGNEDFVVFNARPARARVVYRVDLAHVAGLRLVGRTFELLDAGGVPRVRMAPPFVVDSKGTRQRAQVEIVGCAFDDNPAPPWGRPVTPPGASSCEVAVSWDGTRLAYPLALDPAWTTTGSMAYQRQLLVVVKLGSGYALAAGGYGCTGTCSYTETAELYNPASGTWAATGSMATARYYHAGNALANGNALMVGGIGAAGYLASAEVFDTATGSWSSGGSMAVTRYLPTATLLTSGKVLVAGGYSCTPTCGYTGSTEQWDPATAIWSPAGSLATGRYFHTATRLSTGDVLVAGGYGTSSYLASAERYSPATDSWSAAGSMANARYIHTATPISSATSVLVAGGQGAGGYLASAEIYNSASNAWSATGSLVAARRAHVASLLPNGNVMVAGGFSTASYLASSEVYAVATSSWSTSGNMSVSRNYFGGVLLSTGAVLVAGGYGSGGYLSSAELFRLVANGGACASGGECESRFCVDGVCCDTSCTQICNACSTAKKGTGANGVCGPIVSGTDPDSECADQGALSCGTTGFCSGSGACSNYATGTQCGNPVCAAGQLSTFACNGGGSCLTTQAACAPYVCATSTACATSCTTDANCAASGWCRVSDNTCQNDQASGAPCTSASQCNSGVCVDGVCCATACTGLCMACSVAKKGSGIDGDCGPVKDGSDPDIECTDDGAPSCDRDGQCNGAGACRLYAKGTSCGSTVCVGNTVTGLVCDGLGGCVNDTTGTDCTPYKCAVNKCTIPCASDTDCTAGNFCEAGTCKAKQLTGATCTGTNACLSGYCVDGVCCATACTGLCNACSVVKKGGGVGGECGPVKNGTDPDNECATDLVASCDRDGTCNGAGACRLYAKGTSCGANVCSGNSLNGQSCDGFGSCTVNATGTDCTPFVCAAGACKKPCAADVDCTSGNFCKAGVCTPKQASGAGCGGGNECQSSYCIDGVCCITPCTGLCQACSAAKKGQGVDGDCAAVVNGADPDNDCPDDGSGTCQRDGSCNGFGACRLFAKATSCGPSACVGNKVSGKFCDGFGTCQFDPVGSDCAPYQCLVDKCTNPCATDADCTNGNYCDSGACKGKQLVGATCTGSNQCQSGQCVDGVCCATPCTGTCQACSQAKKGGGPDGICEPVKDGTDPDDDCPDDGAATCKRDGQCSGTGLCRFYSKGVSCGTTSCIGNFVKGHICDGLGSCEYEPLGVDCAPYVCQSDKCSNPCTQNTDCLTGTFCDNGSCTGKLATGTACNAGTQCQSGFCVDGYCCESACNGQCEACDVAPNQGTCSPVTGAPHASRPVCKGAGTPCEGSCDGVNNSACEYPGSASACDTSCADGNETPSFCSGNGVCLPSTPKSCSPYVCEGTDKCKTSCAASKDCASGYVCGSAKNCVPAGNTCVDSDTLKLADGTTKECAPYKCDTGACRTSCGSVDDCVLPAVCRASDNTCAKPGGAASSDSGGCGCRTPGSDPRRTGGPAALLAALALAFLAFRRDKREKRDHQRSQRS